MNRLHHIFRRGAAAASLSLLIGWQAQAQSSLDGFDPNANNGVRVIVVQPDGKILLGGEFTTLAPNGGPAVPRNYIARLHPDGTLDTAFNPNANGSVHAIVVQGDGKILVSGGFTTIGGGARNYIARLDGTTGAADSFIPNANGLVRSIALQADGKVIAGGDFSAIGGQARIRIARLESATGAADSFDPKADGPVFTVAVQRDGKVLAGGLFSQIGGQVRNRVARLHGESGLVDSFNAAAGNDLTIVYAFAVQEDGKILVAGEFTSMGGQMRNHVARLDATTGQADSFNPNAQNSVHSLALQPDGKILAVGAFTSIGGQPRDQIARLDPSTGLADSFDPGLNGFNFATAVAVQPDGKVLVGGIFSTFTRPGEAPVTRNNIARFEIDGRLDRTLNLGTIGFFVTATAIQPDGKILIGGDFNTVLGVTRNHIARLNTDGTLDLAFNPNANRQVNAIAVQPDGKILVGGFFFGANSIGGATRYHLARLDPVTGAADPFNPDPDAEVWSITPHGGKIYVGGVFRNIGGAERPRIARLDAVTGVPDSFNPIAFVSNSSSGSVNAIVPQADGKILVGGFFTHIGGQMRNGVARLDPATGFPDSFDPSGALAAIFTLAVQADGKVLIGGQFSGANSMGGQPRNNIARVDAAGVADDSFDPNANSIVNAITLQADGKILVGGLFNTGFGATTIGGQTRNHIARLDPATGLADSFNPNANGQVYSLVLQTDGKILAAGQFGAVGGETRSLFARLSNDTAAGQDLAVTRDAIRWSRGGSSLHFKRVTFESSTDNLNYSPLGDGTSDGSDWTLTGLAFPTGQNFYVRARGYYNSRGSETILESVRQWFIAATTTGSNASGATMMGGTISGTAVISGGVTPTGTVTFHVYGPDDATCGGPAAFSATVNVKGNGTYSSPQFTPTSPGTYRVVAIYSGDTRNTPSASGCNDAGATVVVSKKTPTLVTAASPAVFLGGSVSDSATLSNGFNPSGTITFNLYGPNDDSCGGPAIFSSTATVNGGNGTYSSGSFVPGATGTYRWVAAYSGDNNNESVAGACNDAGEIVEVKSGLVGNVATRLPVGTGDNALIQGFIVQGPAGSTKKIMVRALGPVLTQPQFGITDALANPSLEIRDGTNVVVATNNDWKKTEMGILITADQSAEISSSGLAPSDDLESAVIVSLAPGNYTAVVRGVGDTTGTGIVDAYDMSPGSPARLANIATRGFIQPGDKLMIAGFIIQHGSVRAAIRAIGPSLTAFGITNALSDTTLELRDENGDLIMMNDDWKTDPAQKQELESNGLQPSHDREAALIRTIAPGQYTALVRGKGAESGIGVVEVYFLQ